MNFERRTTDEVHSHMHIIRHSLLILVLAACSTTPSQPVATQAPLVSVSTEGPAALPTLTPAPAISVQGLYVDPAQNVGPISPLVYGSNYGPWLGISLDMRELASTAGFTFMRFPAGSWGDQNDVTPLQIDQFIALCKDLGCAPMINVRLQNSTAEKAAELVRYTNITKGYKVRYWGIGNEPNLYIDNYSIERFNREWREWAGAMLDVDPSIQLLGPEVSQFFANPKNNSEQVFQNWLVEFLKTNGDMVDIVTVHRYPFPPTYSSNPPSISDLRDNVREWDANIPALRALVREYAGRDLPLGITEINSSWAPNTSGEGTMDSHYNAIWWGDVLGRMIREGVDIVAQFDLSRQFGIFGQFGPHPMFYTYRMYRQFGNNRVYAASDDPTVSIYAAKRPGGTLTLMVINLSSQSVDKMLSVTGLGTVMAETWLFDSTHQAEQTGDTVLTASTPLHLTPESITLYIIP